MSFGPAERGALCSLLGSRLRTQSGSILTPTYRISRDGAGLESHFPLRFRLKEAEASGRRAGSQQGRGGWGSGSCFLPAFARPSKDGSFAYLLVPPLTAQVSASSKIGMSDGRREPFSSQPRGWWSLERVGRGDSAGQVAGLEAPGPLSPDCCGSGRLQRWELACGFVPNTMAWGVSDNRNLFSHSLEAGSPKSKMSRGHAPSKLPGRGLPASPGGRAGRSVACGRVSLIPTLSSQGLFPPSVSKPPCASKNTSLTGCRAPPPDLSST